MAIGDKLYRDLGDTTVLVNESGAVQTTNKRTRALEGVVSAEDGQTVYITPSSSLDGSTTVSQSNKTITTSTVSASGTVAAGAYRVVFELSADFTGSILGITRTGSTARSIDFDGGVARLNAIAYTRTTGTLTITEYR